MKKIGLYLIAYIMLLLTGITMAAETNTNTVAVNEFYITTSIYAEGDITEIMELTDTIAHMQKILDDRGITSKRSYIAKPFYDGIKNLQAGRDDYAYADFALAKKRMIERKIWREPRKKRTTYGGSK